MTEMEIVIESDRPVKVTVKSGIENPLARLLADIEAIDLEDEDYED